MDDAERLFAEEEIRAERTLGMLRIVVALVLGTAFALAVVGATPPDDLVRARQILYALLTIAAYLGLGVVVVLLAGSRHFRRWMAWLFVTCDVAFVVVSLELTLANLGLAGHQAAMIPGMWLVPVVLAFGALRYDPRLQAYVVALVLAGLGLILIAGGSIAAPAAVPAFLFALPPNLMRLVMVALAGAILVLAAARARSLLRRAIDETRRAANLTRYLPREIASRLAEAGIEEARRGRHQPVAVMFVDIRGFTGLAETMDPERLGAFLGGFRRLVADAASSHGGVIDKFIGDSAMLVFGIPEARADDARRALEAARDLGRRIAAWNAERAGASEPPVAVSVGLHHGEAFCGAVGDAERLEYTVLGDTVNVAARLEEAAKRAALPLVVSEQLLLAAGEVPDGRWRALAATRIRGRERPVRLYAEGEA